MSSIRSRSASARRRVLASCAAAAVVALGATNAARADDGVARTGPYSKQDYPVEVIYRPLTLPQQMVETSLSAGYWWLHEEPNIAVAWAGLRYGIVDRWSASLSTGLRTTPNTGWLERVAVSTRYLALDTKRVDIAPGVWAPVDFSDEDGAHMFPGVTVDATTRIYLTDRIALTVGEGLVPIGLGNESLSIDMNYSAVFQRPGRPFGTRFAASLFHLRVYGDVRGSTFPGQSWLLGAFYSPNNRCDFRLNWTIVRGSNALSAGVTARM